MIGVKSWGWPRANLPRGHKIGMLPESLCSRSRLGDAQEQSLRKPLPTQLYGHRLLRSTQPARRFRAESWGDRSMAAAGRLRARRHRFSKKRTDPPRPRERSRRQVQCWHKNFRRVLAKIVRSATLQPSQLVGFMPIVGSEFAHLWESIPFSRVARIGFNGCQGRDKRSG
jgi:hypothetical protein